MVVAYKVSTLDPMGFDHGEQYYFDIKQAENDFYTRLYAVIKDNEHLATTDDLDGHSPWKIKKVHHRENQVLRAYYSVWDEWCTQDGCESDIVGEEIVIEKIFINGEMGI